MPLDGLKGIDTTRIGQLGSQLSSAPTAEMPATVLQLAFEAPIDVCRSLLPPALHPLNPGVLVVMAYEVERTDRRPSFRTVEVGIQCRAGARARRYVLGAAISDPRVASEMESSWGYLSQVADIALKRRHERIELTVAAQGRTVLDASLLAPEPVTPSAVMYVAGLRAILHADKPWIAQFERSFEISRADRGRPEASVFDGAWWTGGDAPGLRALAPISASFTRADVTLNPIRFLIDPTTSRSADTRRLSDVVG
jgi:hypothetical protein